MKKLLYTVLFLGFVTNTKSQESRLAVGIVGGPAFAREEFKKMQDGGMGLSISVLYNFNSYVSAGIEGNLSRFEPYYHGFGNEKTSIDGVLFKGLFHLNTETKARPYFSVMAGYYNNTFYVPTGYDGDAWDEAIYSNKFGGGVSFGVHYKVLNFEIAYNNIGRLKANMDHWGQIDNANAVVAFVQVKVGVWLSFFKKKN